MTAKSGDTIAAHTGMYARQLAIRAPRQTVFDAIGTLDGPRHWWTTIVTGSAEAESCASGSPGWMSRSSCTSPSPARPPRSAGHVPHIPGTASGREQSCGSHSSNADLRHVSWTSGTPAFRPSWWRRAGTTSWPAWPPTQSTAWAARSGQSNAMQGCVGERGPAPPGPVSGQDGPYRDLQGTGDRADRCVRGRAGRRWQGDLVVHGGAGRAVYAYAAENLWFWRACLGVDELAPGWFGENLTLAGFPMADAKLPSPSRSIPCCGPTRSAPCSTSPRPQASPYPPPAASAPAAPAGSRSKMAA